MKTGKQIKIDGLKKYNVIYGCVDNRTPKSVYVNLTSWVEPKTDDEFDYDKVIKKLHKKIKQTIYNYLNAELKPKFIKNTTIIDLDLRESGIKFGKRSFMSCEINLFQIEDYPINSEIIKDSLNKIVLLVTEKNFEMDEHFNYFKKK
jgi:hypothetical protein